MEQKENAQPHNEVEPSARDGLDCKRFTTLQAHFALLGHSLTCAWSNNCPRYLVSRWGMLKELASLDDVDSFLHQIRGAA